MKCIWREERGGVGVGEILVLCRYLAIIDFILNEMEWNAHRKCMHSVMIHRLEDREKERKNGKPHGIWRIIFYTCFVSTNFQLERIIIKLKAQLGPMRNT